MKSDPIAALIGVLEGIQARVALAGDRALLRQIVSADATHMLTGVPASARNVLVSAQVEGRLNATRRGHPNAITLLMGEELHAIGFMTLDWPVEGPVMLLDLLILPHLRGQGRGARALSALTRVADACRQPVRAGLFYDSPALRLLSRIGFTLLRDEGTEVLLQRAV